MGCTSMFVIALVGLAMLLGVAWWGFGKIVNEYSSSQPAAVQTETTEADFAAANSKLNAVREASRSNQPATVEFTSAEINALIARHEDFKDLRGRFRLGMANSEMTLDMSVPLAAIKLPRIRDRWLNGTARFGLIYHDDNFSFSLRSLTANGNDFSMRFLEGFATSFNEKFNEGFVKARRKTERSADFWESVKTLAVVDDKLVLTTTGAEAEDVDVPEEPEPTNPPQTL